MVYPHKWSPISYTSSAGQQKHAGQRPMLYRWTSQPTSKSSALSVELLDIIDVTVLSRRPVTPHRVPTAEQLSPESERALEATVSSVERGQSLLDTGASHMTSEKELLTDYHEFEQP